jgi:signal transduction histidine kinase
MERLIDDLMGLARVTRSKLNRERIDLKPLAQAVVDELRRAEPGRSVAFVCPPRVPAQADSSLLRIVLQNLLANAWKFTSRKEQARIELGQTDAGGEPAFFVRDNGAGFEMA